jgi:hypothetical protein
MSTLVRGSSAVVTTTRPLGSRIWRETLPGVSKTCIDSVLVLARKAAEAAVGALARLPDPVAGVDEGGVVERKRCQEHVLLLS